jgi:hypothetical protein
MVPRLERATSTRLLTGQRSQKYKTYGKKLRSSTILAMKNSQMSTQLFGFLDMNILMPFACKRGKLKPQKNDRKEHTDMRFSTGKAKKLGFFGYVDATESIFESKLSHTFAIKYLSRSI